MLKKEKYNGRCINKDFKYIMKLETEKVFEERTAKHEANFQKLKAKQVKKDTINDLDEVYAMELCDGEIEAEAKQLEADNPEEPVIEGNIVLTDEEKELLKIHPKMTDFKRIDK